MDEMARVLTGVQSTGRPHLGNILGAIRPAVEMADQEANEAFLFIADLHSLTSMGDPERLHENTLAVAAGWLAFGFDIEKNYLYRQSDVPEVCELTWYLSCFASYSMLTKAHSFKDRMSRNESVNAGLFTYPILMAADILMYDAEVVPVGKDQKQHLEMTRDMAQRINQTHGEVLTVPEARIDERVMTVPGIDGQKMSKSYDNYIDIFLPEKKLKKNIGRIVTDSKEVDDPKDPEACNVFKLYELLADPHAVEEMRKRYQAGGYGYGHAKNALFELILDRFSEERKTYNELMENRDLLEQKLKMGADKASEEGQRVLDRVRRALGYKGVRKGERIGR